MSAPRATRGRTGRIDALPAALRERIDALLRAGVSQREIIARLERPLAEAGEPPLSPAGLCRYAARAAEIGRWLQEGRAIADTLVDRFGERPAGRTGDLAVEVLRTAVFDLVVAARRDGQADPETVGQLALAIQRLERTAQMSQRREIELRREIAAEAADAAGAEARRRGISPETEAAIRAAIQGEAA